MSGGLTRAHGPGRASTVRGGRYDAIVLPIYEFTCELATLQPPSPDMQRLLGAAHGNQEAMDQFARVNAGAMSPAEFFGPENARRILAAAGPS